MAYSALLKQSKPAAAATAGKDAADMMDMEEGPGSPVALLVGQVYHRSLSQVFFGRGGGGGVLLVASKASCAFYARPDK